MKFCCVTGHRKIKSDYMDYVKMALRAEIEFAIKDGYTSFISGFADGVDLYFAQIVCEIKKENPDIQLIAAIPYPRRLKTKNSLFQKLYSQCDTAEIISKEYLNAGTLMKRNRWMIDRAERVIAVYDGRPRSGTLNTIEYAKALEREIYIITLKDVEEVKSR